MEQFSELLGDDPELDARRDVYLQKLSAAGVFPLYWHRQNKRGHLEIYFSEPVNADAAYQWCLSACPELAEIPECFPVKNRSNHGYSWPLYQRVEERVYECLVSYWSGEDIVTLAGIANEHAEVISLIERAVTPASLIPNVLARLKTSLGHGGVLLEKSQGCRAARKNTDYSPDADLAKSVIAEFNETHTWKEVTALCGGLKNNRFCAAWRGEKHPSVVIDPNGLYACDYGRIGTEHPKKLDKYEIWCLSQGIEKKKDLAERIAVYRKEQRAEHQTIARELDGGVVGFLESAEPVLEDHAQKEAYPRACAKQETSENEETRGGPDTSEAASANGQKPHLQGSLAGSCPYRLTIAEDAHPCNIEKYQHHRRVQVIGEGNGWLTFIGKDRVGVVLDSGAFRTEHPFHHVRTS